MEYKQGVWIKDTFSPCMLQVTSAGSLLFTADLSRCWSFVYIPFAYLVHPTSLVHLCFHTFTHLHILHIYANAANVLSLIIFLGLERTYLKMYWLPIERVQWNLEYFKTKTPSFQDAENPIKQNIPVTGKHILTFKIFQEN